MAPSMPALPAPGQEGVRAQNNLVDGFTKKYGVHTLVWFERHETMESAITREKQIKKWNRDWKLQLIEESNSAWRDLYEDVV